MLSWLKSKFVLQLIKQLLDKLPADGKKTILGLIILVAGVAAPFFHGQIVGDILVALIEIIKGMNYEDVAGTGIGVMLVGLLHKALKWFFSEDQKK